MEHQFLSFPMLFAFIISLLMLVKLGKRFRTNNLTPNLPPGPWKLLVIGNLHLLAGPLPHQTLSDMAKKYGSLMHLQLGQLSNIVVSSPQTAAEVMKTHDIIFASRPSLLPRECSQPCKINGYDIPVKSRVIINAWAIGRNSKYWNEAEKFYPERFLNSSIDYKGSHFELIPFGAGRRMCPGMLYGIANVELSLAQLLYHFDWKLAEGRRAEDIDMDEVFGAVVRRKNELCLVPEPCSSPNS